MIVVDSKNVVLDIMDKNLNPEFNSFANCKHLYIPSTQIYYEDFLNYKPVVCALCFDHVHFGN
jgi:hypothetical protein